jgi:flagellin
MTMGFQNGFRINTNTSAVNTYRSYSVAQAGLERNIERLSSGLRINKAADDTAGLAISQRMNNQIRGMQQANRNVQQANNMMQTAEGGLNQIHGILARMRELAVQSASDGVNGDDRASIDLEFQQLKAEITRIGDGTEYNNMKLIDGSRAKKAMDGTDGTSHTMGAVVDNSLKSASFAKTGTYSLVARDTDGDSVDETMELYFTQATAAATDANTNWSLVDRFVKAEGGGLKAGNEIQFDDAGLVLKLDDSYGQASHTVASATTDVTNASGEVIGYNITGATSAGVFTVDDSVFTSVQVGANNDSDQAASVASVGDSVTENRITFNLADTTSEGLGISTVDLTSLGEAQSAVNYLDAAIQKVNDERSNIGSLQNRFEFTSSNLLNSIQNNSASMSTIRDADFAVEAADLARNQILTQSGTAMLAQANQISQNVLSLLR